MKTPFGPCRDCNQHVLKLHDQGRPIRLDPTPLTAKQVAAAWLLARTVYWLTPHGPIPIPPGDTGLATLPRHVIHTCRQPVPNHQPPATDHDLPPY
jgi:hypothetical protein